MNVESLHIGLNRVDPAEHDGWPGFLPDAIHDARDLSLIAARYGCRSTSLFDEDATVDRVTAELKAMAGRLHAGDAFVVSYHGHGSTSAVFGDQDQQSLVLYDAELSDRAFRSLLALFEEMVSGLCLMGNCYSGGMDRFSWDGRSGIPRVKPFHVQSRSRVTGDAAIVRASVVMLTACTSQEEALSTGRNGAWEGSMIATLKEFEAQRHHPTWEEWHEATVRMMSLKYPMQHPQLKNLSGTTFIGSQAWTFKTAPTPMEPPPVFPTVPPPSQI